MRKRKSKVAEAIRAELRAAIEVEPFNAGSLAAISRVAKIGSRLLRATSSDVDSLLPKKKKGVMAPSPAAETFGTNALREIMALLKPTLNPAPYVPPPPLPPMEFAPSFSELQLALAQAKEDGMSDMVRKIEKAMDARLNKLTSQDPPLRLPLPRSVTTMVNHRVKHPRPGRENTPPRIVARKKAAAQ